MKIKIVYFAYLVPNKWLAKVSSQLEMLVSIGLYDRADEIYLSAIGETEELDTLKNLIESTYSKITIINCSNTNTFEYPGFKTLYEISEPNDLILYFHTKGITSNADVDCYLLERFTICNFEHYISAFLENSYDIGCLFPSITGFAYYNFFWVKGDYIKNHLFEPSIQESRFYWEVYLSHISDDYKPILYSPLNLSFDPNDKTNLFITRNMIVQKLKDTDKLNNLMIKYGTDKQSDYHNYVPYYSQYFSSLEDKKLNILEIGIFRPTPNNGIKNAVAGASLKAWEEYFPNSYIFGADLSDFTDVETDRIKTIKANQEKRQGDQSLSSITDQVPSGFDIIIDDGGHTMEQQQVTLGYMFPFLKSGGIFVIEDLHTSYKWANYNPTQTLYDTLKMLGEFKVTKEIKSDFMTLEEKEYLNENIASIEIFKGKESEIAFIIKK